MLCGLFSLVALFGQACLRDVCAAVRRQFWGLGTHPLILMGFSCPALLLSDCLGPSARKLDMDKVKLRHGSKPCDRCKESGHGNRNPESAQGSISEGLFHKADGSTLSQ